MNKPSVQADFLQMLKMIILHFTKTPKTVEETMKQAIFHLKQAHVSRQKWLAENGLEYEELATEINNPNSNIALFCRLYQPDNPPLRIGDYMNATTEITSDLNYIDIRHAMMLRRIKKNQTAADLVPLSKSVIDFLARRPPGPLFDLTPTELNLLIHKTFPNKTANPHYWRSKFSVDILPNRKNQAELLRYMDHSAKTNALYYHKADGGFIDLILNK